MPATDFHALLARLLPTLRALAPDVEVTFEPALVGAQVSVDSDALEDAAIALIENARDAMPNGGTISIRTEHVDAVGEELGPTPTLSPGHYLRFIVADTGLGMDEGARGQALSSAVDPDDIGSPPRLARVYAMVRIAGGALWLDSTSGFGTRVFVYLPVVDLAPAAQPVTILLVEDENVVRTVVQRMLLAQGFRVATARDGSAALREWARDPVAICAVITDLVMPVMGGRDLARELRTRDPQLPILFISAYVGDEPGLLDGFDPPRSVLIKPFAQEALVDALRGVLSTMQ